MKKVLIITYYWPPSGGPGVQRVLKFAKYLPQLGWEPIILTVKNGEYPAIDESLEKDIPLDCKVFKTNSFEPTVLYRRFTGMQPDEKIPVANLSQKNVSWKKKISNWIRLNLFVPDAKIGWIPYAVKEGKKIIKKEQPDIIFSSSPPPTVHLIAKKLAKWSGIKWVADFRDPWTKIHYLQDKKINSVSRNINKKLEANVISGCDAAVCVSNNFVNLITENNRSKFTIVTNGFDKELNHPADKNPDKFTILYIGGLTRNRFYPEFFKCLVDSLNSGKIDKLKVEILFVGSIDPEILNEIKDAVGIKDINFSFVNYVAHKKALEYMHRADLLLLFLEKVEGYEGHIPGKLFEYISTKNPVLGIGNKNGETAEILKVTGLGDVFTPSEIKEIGDNLVFRYKNWEEKEDLVFDEKDIHQYSRKNLTQKLVKLFNKTL